MTHTQKLTKAWLYHREEMIEYIANAYINSFELHNPLDENSKDTLKMLVRDAYSHRDTRELEALTPNLLARRYTKD